MPNYGDYGNVGGISGYQQQPYYNNPMSDRFSQFGGQYQQPQPNPQPTNNGIIWVQGEEGAKAYLIARGTSVMLMDSENSTFYLKSSDQSGMRLPLRIFDYTERTANKAAPPLQQDNTYFVTREEFVALEDRLNALVAKEHAKPTKSAKTKEDNENG